MAVAGTASKPQKKSQAKKGGSGSLDLRLHGPGMTPILRAGLGGLAASLRAILRERSRETKWEEGVVVPLGPGQATIEAHRVVISWPEGGLEPTLKALWEGSFRISHGVIYLPGAHLEPFDGTKVVPLRLQEGLKRTFLQHGKSTEKDGSPKVLSVDQGEGPIALGYQPFASYAHAKAIKDMLQALAKGTSVELAGWACPGAAQRHVAFGATRAAYAPQEAVAALFSLVGCISLPEGNGGGFLIIPEPNHLISFAKKLPRLLPASPTDTAPASLGDALLLAEMSLLMESMEQPFVASLHGTLLESMAWDKKQKYRAALVTVGQFQKDRMELFRTIRSELKPRLISTKQGTTWIKPSHLRAFAADNLARGRPWYQGFAIHTITEQKQTRFLHTYRSSEKSNLGALQHSERQGLIRMTEQLSGTEQRLVAATHEAIRNQFGKISQTQKALGGDLKKRFQDERQRIRVAFSSAKTQDQVRSAFADLWSRSGSLPTLQAHWSEVMALVHGPKWALARDLALVALASYKGQRSEEEEHAEDATEISAE
ncbi:type I-MYXAN CRISPR-associated Cas8a1/Cmx1 [Geothrix sp. 21YS21S-4]|uniref:type I-MYXAN CRISPR-associated Cas8a1/Cmx1 n=1 Tax=Geothrix sp. 21YS21S-4 TaxID=3068889 RepID=UPI0027B9EDD6|nr:type I-MYXAN CRISPR-associated Cas8a1/Cmx1 [Geothrix sp. 21YS21S-4]